MQSEQPSTSTVVDRREIEKRKFEFLDHPADVQLHAWGDSMEEALEALLSAMFGYMTDLNKIEPCYDYYWTATGHDLDSLIFSFLNEPLNSFQSEPFFVAKEVKLVKFDKENFKIEYYGEGESFDVTRHPQEADIKAITYSNMKVVEDGDRVDIFVIVDI